MPLDQQRGRNLDRTAEDIAQDKRIALLLNKCDELAVAIEQLHTHQHALNESIKPIPIIAEAVKRIEALLNEL